MRKYPPNCILYPVFEDCTFAPVRKTSVERIPMGNKKCDRLTRSLVYPLIERYYSSGELPSTFTSARA